MINKLTKQSTDAKAEHILTHSLTIAIEFQKGLITFKSGEKLSKVITFKSGKNF